MEKAEETWTASIHFNLDITRTDRTLLFQLNEIFKKHPGSCQGYIHLRGPEKTETIIALADDLKLKVGLPLTRDVNGFLGYKAVETVCSPITSSL